MGRDFKIEFLNLSAQGRFGRDVADMNRSVRMAGLLPLAAMVVDQVPIYGGRGYQVAKTAEMLLTKAGAEVLGTENFYRRYNDQIMIISGSGTQTMWQITFGPV